MYEVHAMYEEQYMYVCVRSKGCMYEEQDMYV